MNSEIEIEYFLELGWDIKSIDEISKKVTSGGTPSREINSYYQNGKWPWVKTKELKDAFISATEESITEEAIKNSSAKVLPKNTILMAMYGATVGKLAITSIPMTCNQACCAIIVDEEKANFRFLYYNLFYRRSKIKNLATGAAQQNLNGIQIKQLLFPIPPLPEQKAIAHILGTLDDKIELNRKMNETLEAMAQAIFKSWFVDFDPVRAKASGESVESICRRLHLTPEILDLFPNQLVDSELGEIPEGWEVASIKVAANVIYGAPFSSSKFTSKKMGFPLIRIRDLINQSPKIYTEEIHPKGYMVKGGDIVVGMDGEFKAYIWGGEKGWLNQRTCVFEPKDHFSSSFVFYSIKPCLARVEETETATTVIHIGKNDIDAFRIVIPEANILKIFNLLVYPLFVKLVSKKQESRILASIRDALLPKLLSGEIRVKDMDFSASKSLNV